MEAAFDRIVESVGHTTIRIAPILDAASYRATATRQLANLPGELRSNMLEPHQIHLEDSRRLPFVVDRHGLAQRSFAVPGTEGWPDSLVR